MKSNIQKEIEKKFEIFLQYQEYGAEGVAKKYNIPPEIYINVEDLRDFLKAMLLSERKKTLEEVENKVYEVIQETYDSLSISDRSVTVDDYKDMLEENLVSLKSKLSKE